MTFAEFWSVYPRHVAKIAAHKAYERALKIVSEEKILDGAKRYAADRNRDDRFTKHPATWLNAGCWDDEPQDYRNGHSVIAALDRLDEALARADDHEASAPDLFSLPQR